MKDSLLSKYGPVFGREQEAAAFNEVLSRAERQGVAVLTVGPPGMGKSALLRKFREVAEKRRDLECTVRTFLLDPGADPDVFLERLFDETFRMTRASDGRSWVVGPRSKKQFLALAALVKLDQLIESLAPKEWRAPSRILLDFFRHLSQSMPANRRLVFMIDPEKYLSRSNGQAWVPLLCGLPPKIVLVFAQRPDDVLASEPDLSGATTIPRGELAQLEDPACDEFIRWGLDKLAGSLSKEKRRPAAQALRQLQGWPFAIHASFLLLGGKDPPAPEELRGSADSFSEKLLKQLTREGGGQALKLVYALAVLDVPTPVPILRGYLNLETTDIIEILNRRSVLALVSEHREGFALFHSLFADHVRSQIKRNREWQAQQELAVSLFEAQLDG